MEDNKKIDELFKSIVGMPDTEIQISPGFDLLENEKTFKIQMELPGCSKDDIDIQVVDDVLLISADVERELNDKDDTLVEGRTEGYIEESFRINGIDIDMITSKLSKGILTVTMPKKENKGRARNIKIH